MVRAGILVRLTRCVYLVGGAPFTFQAQLWSAVLATDGVLALSTAGRLWGVVDDQMLAPLGGEIRILLPHSRRIAIPAGVIVHRRRWAIIETAHRSGLPVTPRSATVVDLLATLRGSDAVRLADRAMQRGWISRADLGRRLDAGPRRPGNRQLRRLASSLGDGAAAESERRLHRILRGAGLTGWVANYEVWAEGELVAVIDVAYPGLALAIEVDGMAYHVDVDRFGRDRTRQNTLVALGWTVLRFTWADLTERPGYVTAAVRRLAAA